MRKASAILQSYKRKITLYSINHFFCGTRPIWFPLKRKLLRWAGIQIGKKSRVVGPLYVSCDLIIGYDVWIGRNFSADGNGSVVIGDCCDIAPNVQFYTGTHKIGGSERRAGDGKNEAVIVGEGCWLCAASKFLPGICIGNGVVVAAGSIVTRSFQDNILIGGVPAKIIKTLDV